MHLHSQRGGLKRITAINLHYTHSTKEHLMRIRFEDQTEDYNVNGHDMSRIKSKLKKEFVRNKQMKGRTTLIKPHQRPKYND